jgi:hypothetical protein
MNLNLPPAVWLVIWLASTATACILVAWGAYQAGRDHCDRDHHPARHATGSPPPAPSLPVAGRLDPLPEPMDGLVAAATSLNDWSFFGGAQVEPQPGADEYRLMIAQAAEPCEVCESADEFIARQERQIDAYLGEIEAQTNYLIHTRFAPDE